MERDERDYGEAYGGGDEAGDDGGRFEGGIEEVKRVAEKLKNREEEEVKEDPKRKREHGGTEK